MAELLFNEVFRFTVPGAQETVFLRCQEDDDGGVRISAEPTKGGFGEEISLKAIRLFQEHLEKGSVELRAEGRNRGDGTSVVDAIFIPYAADRSTDYLALIRDLLSAEPQ
jgi:hypothetical protein